MAFILDGFDHREFAFLDPIYEFPWAAFFICNSFEVLPVFKALRKMIFVK